MVKKNVPMNLHSQSYVASATQYPLSLKLSLISCVLFKPFPLVFFKVIYLTVYYLGLYFLPICRGLPIIAYFKFTLNGMPNHGIVQIFVNYFVLQNILE